MTKIARYYHTLKYLKPQQTLGRFFALLKDKNKYIPKSPIHLSAQLIPKVPFHGHEAWNCAAELQKGVYTFLNRKEELGFQNWDAKHLPLLWQFNLHYFHYMICFEESEKEDWQQSWIEANSVGNTVGWHPYPLSLRIINWCKFGAKSPTILQSLYQQAAYLYRHLEFYHPGNHYLENARALVFAGLYFQGQGEADKWMKKGLDIFRKETPKQVLADGGYFERSTMYHAIMLEGYLDLINILPDEHFDVPYLADVVDKMADFLVQMTHPDGQITLFNDSTQEIAPSSQQVLTYYHQLCGKKLRTKSIDFAQSGYYVCQDEDWYLAVDAAPIGPDFLPAHAHADIFSYELSVKGQQFIVDSGVYEYPDGEMRQYNRSTKAHNCVVIDDLNQAECWGSFRVARRYKPKVETVENDEKGFLMIAAFDGYGHLLNEKIVHKRRFQLDRVSRRFFVEDRVNAEKAHRIHSYIHLHPEVEVVVLAANQAMLQRNGVEIRLEATLPFIQIESWYCPRFGQRIPNVALAFQQESAKGSLCYQFWL